MIFVRNSDGSLKAKISDKLFQEILAANIGSWYPHDNQNPSQANNAYVIHETMAWLNEEAHLYFHKGDYLVPEVVP
jgi:hypothetical protein